MENTSSNNVCKKRLCWKKVDVAFQHYYTELTYSSIAHNNLIVDAFSLAKKTSHVQFAMTIVYVQTENGNAKTWLHRMIATAIHILCVKFVKLLIILSSSSLLFGPGLLNENTRMFSYV